MLRLAVITAALALLAAPAASARDMPVTGLTAHFTACPYYADGGSCAQPETAEVWIAPGSSRFEFWHEVGHVFDHQVLDDRAHSWFTRVLGFASGTPWEADEGFYEDHDFSQKSPDEMFADAFAACWLRMKPRRQGGLLVSEWTTAYWYQPSVRQHRRVCNGIAVLGLVRAGLPSN